MTQLIFLIALGCGSADDTAQTTDSTDTSTSDTSVVDTSVDDTGDTTEEVLLFTDEFEDFDAEQWLVVEGSLGASVIKAENVSVLDGQLLLTVSPDPEANPAEWFGGAVDSVEANRFGAWEARIKAPEASGTVCSFMLRQVIELPPSEQAVDVYILNQMGFKIFDTIIKIDTYAQWRPEDGEDGSPTHEGFYFTPFEFDFADWHTYRIEWSHASVAFYVDGELWATPHDAISSEDLSVHLGHWSYADEQNGGEPSPSDSSACLVDYVRGEGFLSGGVTLEEDR
jgi:beta-glucanase (GH16 family)